MRIYYNTSHLVEIAEHLAAMTVVEFDGRPVLAHKNGLRISPNIDGDRLRFCPFGVMANALVYPEEPPTITVDVRRDAKRIAAEVARRLLPPAQTWYSAAQGWRTSRLNHIDQCRATRAIIAPLGETSSLHGDELMEIVGYTPTYWQAKIGAGSVSLNMRSVPTALAAKWLKELQQHESL